MVTNENLAEILLEKAAWKKMSGELALSEEMLMAHRRELDWARVSENSNILWTASMLEQFKNQLDWNLLSELPSAYLFSAANLEEFKTFWNWTNLSENSSIKFTDRLIERFADNWDWSRLINNRWGMEHLYTKEFLDKYSQYIPASELQESELWERIVELKVVELVSTTLA